MPGDGHPRVVERAGTDEADAVMRALEAMSVSDMFTRHGRVRADGRPVFEEYPVRVKRPNESERDRHHLGTGPI